MRQILAAPASERPNRPPAAYSAILQHPIHRVRVRALCNRPVGQIQPRKLNRSNCYSEAIFNYYFIFQTRSLDQNHVNIDRSKDEPYDG